jgi:hypothetical protein
MPPSPIVPIVPIAPAHMPSPPPPAPSEPEFNPYDYTEENELSFDQRLLRLKQGLE